MSVEKNLASVGLFILLAGGIFCTIMVIFKKTKVIEALEYETYYQIGASVSNLFLVFIIGYLTATSSMEVVYKILIAILLVGGLIVELYLTIAFPEFVPDYAIYLLITFNFLFRTYLVVQNIQESWTLLSFDNMSSSGSAPLVRQLEKAVAPAAVEKAQDNEADAFINQFKQLRRQALNKVGEGNLDDREYAKALNEIIRPAAAAGNYSQEKLKEAAKYLKDKAGNVVDLVFGGGRRRRR